MTTKWFMWAVFAIIVVYDAWASSQKNNTTISAELKKTAQNYPILPIAWGILTGHLFWPQR